MNDTDVVNIECDDTLDLSGGLELDSMHPEGVSEISPTDIDHDMAISAPVVKSEREDNFLSDIENEIYHDEADSEKSLAQFEDVAPQAKREVNLDSLNEELLDELFD